MRSELIIDIEAPVKLAHGILHDVSFNVLVEYEPDCNGCGTAEDAKLIGFTGITTTLDVADVEGVTLVGGDESRLFDSWLKVPANVNWLKAKCANHWEEKGRDRWERDCEVERHFSRN